MDACGILVGRVLRLEGLVPFIFLLRQVGMVSKVGLVNLGLGNLPAVANMFEQIAIDCSIFNRPEEIPKGLPLVVPGVGHFSVGAAALDERGWREALVAEASRGTLLMGICLGMQLLGESSVEGDGAGLGLLPFRVSKLSTDGGHRVPHVGWDRVSSNGINSLGITLEDRFYFTHSYALEASGATFEAGYTETSTKTVSVVLQENLIGFQFHPERSGRYGQDLMSRLLGDF